MYVLLKHREVSVEAQKRAGEALHLAYAAEIEALVDVKSQKFMTSVNTNLCFHYAT